MIPIQLVSDALSKNREQILIVFYCGGRCSGPEVTGVRHLLNELPVLVGSHAGRAERGVPGLHFTCKYGPASIRNRGRSFSRELTRYVRICINNLSGLQTLVGMRGGGRRSLYTIRSRDHCLLGVPIAGLFAFQFVT